VKCPTLYIRGDQELRENYPAEEFKANAGGPCEVEIVPDCDHFYNGREEAIQAIVSSWLAKALHLDVTRQQRPSSAKLVPE
jgi:alpha/beta superfamily hydrolase